MTPRVRGGSIRRLVQGPWQHDYPAPGRLLITAETGGSNGYRIRSWKAGLAALAAEAGLEMTCCHFPPGTSKWNKIEHRLFSAITMNWRGRPLTSHEVILNTIAATTTRTGLTVRAELDTSAYPTGVKVSHAEMDALPLARHDWHGDWNYTLHPAPAAAPAPARPRAARPDLAWLAHPAITGLTRPALDALTAALAAPAAQLREARLNRRGYRPRRSHGTGGRPGLPLTDRLTATILRYRHDLLCKAIAALTSIRHEHISRYTGEIRTLLHQASHPIQPAPRKLATIDDLYAHAAAHGIPTRQRSTQRLIIGRQEQVQSDIDQATRTSSPAGKPQTSRSSPAAAQAEPQRATKPHHEPQTRREDTLLGNAYVSEVTAHDPARAIGALSCGLLAAGTDTGSSSGHAGHRLTTAWMLRWRESRRAPLLLVPRSINHARPGAQACRRCEQACGELLK